MAASIAAFVSGMPGNIEPPFARIILACDELELIAKLRTVSKKINRQLQTMEDKIDASGKAVKSNITDNDSAQMRTGNQGALQGYVGVAIADDQHQVICSAMAIVLYAA